jgi:hypothetical protein
LRLKRVGTNISSYGSVDGIGWVQCGESVASDFPATMVVGLETCTTDVGVAPVNARFVVLPRVQIPTFQFALGARKIS